MANVNASEYGRFAGGSGLILANELGGKARIAYFSVNTTTQAISSGDTVNLVTLPKGARILGGKVSFGAMGASATLTIGDAGSAVRLLASTDVSAAGAVDIFAAAGVGYETTDATIIIATAAGANYASAKDLKGYLLYATNA
jgi:hypothetical protein